MMRKLGKLSSAVILGCLLCLTVFCTGAFADSAGYSAASVATQNVAAHAWQGVNIDTQKQGVIRPNGWGRGGWVRRGRSVRFGRFGRFGGVGRFGRFGGVGRFGRFGGVGRFGRFGGVGHFGRFGHFGGVRSDRFIRVTRSIRVTRIIRVTRVRVTRVTRTLHVTRMFRQTRFSRSGCGGVC